MKILLVEDSATLRFAMESFIADAGHETIVAENGETAVQIVDQHDIDMVIMDVEMPGLDGFDTTRLIRESLGENWIPIIFVTGKNDDESFQKGIAVGGDDYLIKPISKIILQAKIGAMERIANMRSQLSQLNEELTRLSQRDGLTDLYNRRTFEEKAREAWRLSTRDKTPLSIMLFDIDFFKRYNDHYGHPAGDECIRRVAETLAGCFQRPGDIIARYGGEEFIAFLSNTDHKGAMHTAELIRSSIQNMQIEHIKSQEFGVVTVSIGISSLRFTTGTNLEKQIEAADTALYNSKKEGRNTISVNNYTNYHSVLLIGKASSGNANMRIMLKDHCDLHLASEEDHICQLPRDMAPKLIFLELDSVNDESIDVYHRLNDSYDFKHVPLVLLSPLEKTTLKKVAKQLGAKDSLRTPIDGNKIVSKLAVYLDA